MVREHRGEPITGEAPRLPEGTGLTSWLTVVRQVDHWVERDAGHAE